MLSTSGFRSQWQYLAIYKSAKTSLNSAKTLTGWSFHRLWRRVWQTKYGIQVEIYFAVPGNSALASKLLRVIPYLRTSRWLTVLVFFKGKIILLYLVILSNWGLQYCLFSGFQNCKTIVFFSISPQKDKGWTISSSKKEGLTSFQHPVRLNVHYFVTICISMVGYSLFSSFQCWNVAGSFIL